jgi:hypothetical protein
MLGGRQHLGWDTATTTPTTAATTVFSSLFSNSQQLS